MVSATARSPPARASAKLRHLLGGAACCRNGEPRLPGSLSRFRQPQIRSLVIVRPDLPISRRAAQPGPPVRKVRPAVSAHKDDMAIEGRRVDGPQRGLPVRLVAEQLEGLDSNA